MFWGFQNNYSLIFDGVNEYINAGDINALDGIGAFSISLWFKAVTVGDYEMLFSKFNSTSSTIEIQIGGAVTGGNNDLAVIMSNGSSSYGYSTDNWLALNTWYHLTYVYDGSGATNPDKVKMYINNVSKTLTFSGTIPTTTPSNSNLVTMGTRLNPGVTYLFNGNIDEVSIWNIALTVAQVSEIYSNGRPANLSGHSGKSGLIGWWRMGDQATWDGTNFTIPDESINNNAGTSVNMEAADKSTDIPVIVFNNNKSLNFDGVNEKVNFGDAAPFQFERTNPFSLSIWAKTTEAVSSKVILAKQDSGSDPGYRIYKKTSGRIEVLLVNSASNRIDVETSTVAINNGAWHHVVMTYSGSSTAAGVKVYVDGVSAAMTVNTNSLTLSILNAIAFQMAAAWNVSLPFIGNLDEPSVWNKELSAAEVTEIYNSGKPKNLLTHSAAVNLVGWWRNGDGDTFPTLIDNSVNANDGTMTNMEAGDIQTDVP